MALVFSSVVFSYGDKFGSPCASDNQQLDEKDALPDCCENKNEILLGNKSE